MKLFRLFITITALLTFLLPSFAQDEAQDEYLVKVVYFLPKDRSVRQDIEMKIDKIVKRVHKFYADQMVNYGYDRKTFRIETDANGNTLVHHVIGKKDGADYRKSASRCFGEFANRIQTRNTILLVFLDHGSGTIGNACGVAYSGKRILIPASGGCFDWTVVAHELGHTFLLPHDFRNGSYIMSYGPGPPNRISACAARWLDVYPYFNPKRIDANKHGEIETLAAVAYPSNDTHVFFEVTDPDGLHMMRILHHYTMMHSYKALSGKRGIVKLTTSTLKSNKAFVQIVDVNGHIKYGGWRSFNGMQPNMVLDISPAGSRKDDGLIGYWTFDEANGEYAFDASGNGSYARLSEGTSLEFNGGKLGGTLRLDDRKESATVAKGGDLINGLDAFTLSLWVKSTKVGTDSGFIFPKTPNGKDEIFSMRYDAEGSSGGGRNVIKAGITTIGGEQTYESASDVQTTEWQHLTLAWQSGRKLKLYINGVLDKPTYNSTATEGEVTDVQRLLIGRGGKDRNRSWEGFIDDVRLYNKVLNEKEIKNLTLADSVVEPSHDVALTGICDLNPETVNANADIEYILTVTNTGKVQDTIKLATSGNTQAALSLTKVSLAPGVSSKVSLTVPGSVRETAGDYVVKVDAISEGDNTKTAQLTTTTSIPSTYEFTLEGIGNLANETTADTDVKYTLKVTNIGNTKGTIQLATSGDAIATLSRPSVSLAPNVSSEVTLSVSGAAPTITTDYLVKVIGTSENDSTKTDHLTTLTTVYPRANARKRPKDSLIGHWNFDEIDGRTASDVSGNRNNAILQVTGNPWMPKTGKIRGALQFKDTDGATVVNGADLINGLDAFTVAFWVKSAEVRTDSGFIFPKTPNGKDEGFSMRYDVKGSSGGGTNIIKAGITTTGGTQAYESVSDVQTTEWQHITMTWRSGREIALYINGVLDQPTFSSKGTQGKVSGVQKLLFGKGAKDTKGAWNGLIDDVRLYNRVLSGKEIANLPAVKSMVWSGNRK